jgi:probable FeS assembly SUF system protein SufT
MQSTLPVQLTRECEVVQIPTGLPVRLPAGTAVDITQSLGGGYTIRLLEGGLFRLSGDDADALGLARDASSGSEAHPQVEGETIEARVWAVLRGCFDPEIPVNVVDLGLVYDVKIETLPSGRNAVNVKMTLTAQGCGMGGMIAGDAQARLLGLEGVEQADVQIVWDPPWHPGLISENGRQILGLD